VVAGAAGAQAASTIITTTNRLVKIQSFLDILFFSFLDNYQ
jgi:hypothetical protein